MSNIDSSFVHLQSIVLRDVQPLKIDVLIVHFKQLSNLFSLKIVLFENFHEDLNTIYEMVFQLSVLKTFQLNISNDNLSRIMLPIANTNQHTSLERMIINHELSLNELYHLVSYTPFLRYLECLTVDHSNNVIGYQLLNLSLHYLKVLNITFVDINFNQFEIFLHGYGAKLNSINIKIFDSHDLEYFQGHVWENLLQTYTPFAKKILIPIGIDLRKERFQQDAYYSGLNHFSSLRKNKLFLQMNLDLNDITICLKPIKETPIEIEYLILNDNDNNAPIIKLIVDDTFTGNASYMYLHRLRHVFNYVQITYLEVNNPSDLIIKLLNLLPKVQHISISKANLRTIFVEQKNVTESFQATNKIISIVLGDVLAHFHFNYFQLFPNLRTIYLKKLDQNCLQNHFKNGLLYMRKNTHSLEKIYFFVEDAQYNEEKKLKNIVNMNNMNFRKKFVLSRKFRHFLLELK